MSTPGEPLPDTGFDPLLFWDTHKSKVLLYGGLFAVALTGYGIFEVAKHHQAEQARRTFALASKPEDYRKVIEEFPKSVVSGNAALELGAALRREKKYDESAATLRKFVNDNPEHPLVSSGWMSLAATLEEQGKPDEALDIYRQVATKYPASHDAPLAMISQAAILRGTGKLDDAKRTYESVMSQFPESYYAQQASQELRMLKVPAAASTASASPAAAK